MLSCFSFPLLRLSSAARHACCGAGRCTGGSARHPAWAGAGADGTPVTVETNDSVCAACAAWAETAAAATPAGAVST
ncbi:hypothetical protein, partial [Paraburkholderia sp. Ac-20347]|uniref:hypothetical protein n=1 Tax=Paraburkholderia sp. Ac-20347 TaxID=2703892 RepID=UPI00198200A9